MKKFFAVFLSFAIATPQSFAAHATVVIRAKEASERELERFVEVNGSFQSLSENILSKRIKHPERTELLRIFENAQREFLAGSMEKAKIEYSQIASKVHTMSWLPAERKIIFSAMYRLAQLESASEQKWLEAAAQFAPDLKADDKLFPPPLLKRAVQIKQTILKRSVLWRPSFVNEVSSISVDGQRYSGEKTKNIVVTPGLHLIEVFSNSRLPLSKKVHQDEIQSFKFDSDPMVSGSCEEPALGNFPNGGMEDVAIFYSIGCVMKLTSNGWINLSRTKFNVDPSEFNETKSLALPSIPEVRESKKSPWIWWALAGAVVTGALIIEEKNRTKPSGRIEPTHETGFKQ
jgi:hypothetical protein